MKIGPFIIKSREWKRLESERHGVQMAINLLANESAVMDDICFSVPFGPPLEGHRKDWIRNGTLKGRLIAAMLTEARIIEAEMTAVLDAMEV